MYTNVLSFDIVAVDDEINFNSSQFNSTRVLLFVTRCLKLYILLRHMNQNQNVHLFDQHTIFIIAILT